MDTKSPRTPAFLLLAGLALSLVGMLLADAGSTEEASTSTWVGGLVLLAGFAAVMAGLGHWARRSRRSPASQPARSRASV